MSFRSDQVAYGASGQCGGAQQAGWDYQQACHHAPLELQPQEHTFVPPLPAQQGLYDPFAHADSPQNPPVPLDACEAPPLPPEETPPLPLDEAPPLPSEPAEPHLLPGHLVDLEKDQETQAPLPELAQTAFQMASWSPQTADLLPWSAIQHTGYEAYHPQQVGWQQGPYNIQNSAYSQPPGHQQPPWQPQQLQYQQPPQQQHVHQYPQAYPAPVHIAPPTAALQPVAAAQPVQQPAARIITDAASIFLQPGRATRPKRLAIVLRGLPGSGKSHIAKKLKHIEVEQGGEAPRIHAIDDYFYTEVEKEVMEEVPGKKPRKRSHRQMEYCYEAELEGTYKASMVQAFQRTVKETRFAMVIVDAPNLSLDDLKIYWAAGQHGGYEVYIVEVTDVSPEQCQQRNIHNRTLDDITMAAEQWQATPPTYPLLDLGSLLGANKKKAKQVGIAEVEMEEDSAAEGSQGEEEDGHATAKPVSSKWTSEAEERPAKRASSSNRAAMQGMGSSKRAKPGPAPDHDYDGLTAGLDGFFGKTQGHRGMRDNAKSTRGVLKKVMLACISAWIAMIWM
ncbi:hypothetical protein ABBQ32_001512 [Trebouxia sp. C0010 RCD-2024]